MTGTVGVLGGMGPAATVEFMRRVVAATPAADDADHLRLIVDNNPKVPSRLQAILAGTGDDPAPVLADMAKGLVRAGAAFLAMPCNTAHHYLPTIRAAVRVPVLDMIGETLDVLAERPGSITEVGLLASPALRRVGLLDERFREAGIAILHPEAADEAVLEDIIRAVKANRPTVGAEGAYAEVERRLTKRGAQALLIACTELSMLAPPPATLPVLDTLDILVAATIRDALAERGSA